jgi:hypothetical protein
VPGLTIVEVVCAEVAEGDARRACMRTIREVEATLGVRIAEVDLDLVDIPEIAQRLLRSRQSVQQLVTGVRGPGGFPAALGAPGGIRVWDWTTVAQWLQAVNIGEVLDIGLARVDVMRVNAWLATRAHGPDLDGLLVDAAATD